MPGGLRRAVGAHMHDLVSALFGRWYPGAGGPGSTGIDSSLDKNVLAALLVAQEYASLEKRDRTTLEMELSKADISLDAFSERSRFFHQISLLEQNLLYDSIRMTWDKSGGRFPIKHAQRKREKPQNFVEFLQKAEFLAF